MAKVKDLSNSSTFQPNFKVGKLFINMFFLFSSMYKIIPYIFSKTFNMALNKKKNVMPIEASINIKLLKEELN